MVSPQVTGEIGNESGHVVVFVIMLFSSLRLRLHGTGSEPCKQNGPV